MKSLLSAKFGRGADCGTLNREGVVCAETQHHARKQFVIFKRLGPAEPPSHSLIAGWAGDINGAIYDFDFIWPQQLRLRRVWPHPAPVPGTAVTRPPTLQPEFELGFPGGTSEGMFALEVEIDAAGAVQKVTVLNELANGAGAAAAAELLTRRFRPAMLFDAAVPVRYYLPLRYANGRISTSSRPRRR